MVTRKDINTYYTQKTATLACEQRRAEINRGISGVDANEKISCP